MVIPLGSKANNQPKPPFTEFQSFFSQYLNTFTGKCIEIEADKAEILVKCICLLQNTIMTSLSSATLQDCLVESPPGQQRSSITGRTYTSIRTPLKLHLLLNICVRSTHGVKNVFAFVKFLYPEDGRIT